VKTFPLNFTHRFFETCNAIFNMDERLAALGRCRNTSPGPDGIQNEMLSHVPLAGKKSLLSAYNGMWTESLVPDAWKEAIVSHALKPGTDRSQANNYRPISLTSCLCNTMERMVNSRLVWVLGSQNLSSGHQCEFRRHRFALDHLVNLQCDIQNQFVTPKSSRCLL
jgi:potassium voltage-gated channel Eag-related subfamily H protein 8